MEATTATVELPQYGIAVNEQHQLFLTITYQTSMCQFYLCEPGNYEETARKIHKGIMDAGREARRAKSGLVVAGGNHDATLRSPQGGQQSRSRRPRP